MRHHTRYVGVWLLLLVTCSHVVYVAQAVSKLKVLDQTAIITDPIRGNTTSTKEYSLTFTARDGDNTAQDVNIGGIFYDIDCPVPKIPHSVALRAFTTNHTLLFVYDACVYDGNQALNRSAVLAAQPIAPNAIHDLQQGPNRRLLVAPVVIAGLAFWAGATVSGLARGESFGCAISFGLLGCKSSDSGPSYTAAQIDQLNALDAWAAAQTRFDSSIVAGLTQQQKINFGFQSVLLNQQTQLNAVGKQVVVLEQSVNVLANQIDRNQNFTQQQFQIAYGDMITLATANFAYTDTNVEKLQKAIIQSNTRILNITSDVAQNASYNDALITQRLRRLGQDVATLINDINRDRTKRDVRRSQFLGQAANIANMRAAGYEPMFHPDFPPIMPTAENDMLEFDREIIVDRQCINWVNDSTPGVPRVHQLCYGIFCAAGKVLDELGLKLSWQDMLEVLGPAGCVANATASGVPIVSQCYCWIGPITNYECASAPAFHWDMISNTPALAGNRANYVLPPGQPNGKCSSTTAPTVPVASAKWNGRYIDDLNTWLSLINPLCATTLSPSPNHPNKFQFYSDRLGVFDIPAPTNPDICSFQVDTLFEQGKAKFGTSPEAGIVSNSLPFTIYTAMSIGYALMWLDTDTYEQIRYGQVIGMDEEVKFFSMTTDGHYAVCYRTIIAGSDGVTLPVSVATQQPVLAACTVTGYNRPRICPTGQTCPATRTVTVPSITASYNPSLNLPLLPAGYPIIGEITPTGTTFVCDPEAKSTSVSLNGRARANSVTYWLTPVPAAFHWPTTPASQYPKPSNMKVWMDNYGPFWEHKSAASTAALTVRALDQSGRCEMPEGVDPNELCAHLAQAAVDPSTDMRNGIFVTNPDTWTGDISVSIPRPGDIIVTVIPGCPTMTFRTNSDGSSNNYIVNNLPYTVTVTLQRTSSNAACQGVLGTIQMTLLAGQEWDEVIPVTCGNYQAQLLALNPQGQLVPCFSSPKVITVNPRASGSANISSNIQVNVTYIQDQVKVGLNVVYKDVLDVLTSVQNILPILVDPNTSVFDKIQKSNKTINDAIEKTKQDQSNANIDTGSAFQQLQNLNAQFNAADKDRLIAQAAATKQLASQAAAIASMSTIIKGLIIQNNQTAATAQTLHEKDQALIQAIQNTAQTCSASLFDSSGWDTNKCSIGSIIAKAVILLFFILALVAFGYVLYRCIGSAEASRSRSNVGNTPSLQHMRYERVARFDNSRS